MWVGALSAWVSLRQCRYYMTSGDLEDYRDCWVAFRESYASEIGLAGTRHYRRWPVGGAGELCFQLQGCTFVREDAAHW